MLVRGALLFPAWALRLSPLVEQNTALTSKGIRDSFFSNEARWPRLPQIARSDVEAVLCSSHSYRTKESHTSGHFPGVLMEAIKVDKVAR